MRNSAMTARPTARKATQVVPGTGNPRVKKTLAVAAVTRKSEPIIALVERRSSPNLPELNKKAGSLPTPIATFTF